MALAETGAANRPPKTSLSMLPQDLDVPWAPPVFDGELKTRLGGNLVDGFVAGHDATDVLRELVQNEFDAGGSLVNVVFGQSALTVTGNGRAINAKGWSRLSVIIGTGRVVGEEGAAPVEAKSNGIGSKNFGLRSLFLFGDRIYVGSGQDVAVLDLQKLGTGRVKDPRWKGGTGVRINVPYRAERFEKLSPFTVEAEHATLDAMAEGMLATLVKLALVGKKRGIRDLVLRSDRTGRQLKWAQRAKPVRTTMRGVTAISRAGRVTDRKRDGPPTSRSFEEIEFSRPVELPREHRDASIPDYYRRRGNKIAICVSLPIKRRRIDLSDTGHFYYPLEAPQALTGSCISVSAPFELNNDRTALISGAWNSWLCQQAAALVTDLIKGDWVDRYGADALKALARTGTARPEDLASALAMRLSSEDCWPSRARGKDRFVKASAIVLPEAPELDGFLEQDRYLDQALSNDPDIAILAKTAGALTFNVNALVRLRCVGADGAKVTSTKGAGEADFHFPSYAAALGDESRQVKMAAALTALRRHLSKENRGDLKNTASTLAADGTLKRAAELVRVEAEIWDVPEPMGSRLHLSLTKHRAIAGLCATFDEEGWMCAAAARAQAENISEDEREAIWLRILREDVPIGRLALAAVRRSPVVKDHKGAWVAATDLVQLKGKAAKLLGSVLSYPSEDLWRNSAALARLRVRQTLTGADLVAFAKSIEGRPAIAARFEGLLQQHTKLLTPGTVNALAKIPILTSGDGKVAAPEALHLDTALNRICLGDAGALVSGSNSALYRRLRVSEFPTLTRLLDVIQDSKARGEAPPRPEILYPETAAAISREHLPKGHLATSPILWAANGYHAPHAVLVGNLIPRHFDGAVPVVRGPESLVQAYLRLGASGQPQDEHWNEYFRFLDAGVPKGHSVPSALRRQLLDAYRQRSFAGLPNSLETKTRCLLARDGQLFSVDDARAGRFVEEDYPALASSLTASGATVAFADLSERARQFMSTIGLSSLTSLCGAGTPAFGAEVDPPTTFKEDYRDQFLAFKARPIFAAALHRLAAAQQRTSPGFHVVTLAALRDRLDAVDRISFLDSITRDYVIGGKTARVPVETAVRGSEIGVVKPRTKLDFQQLLAQSLAEISGASDIAAARALATSILPLVLSRTADDVRVYLERMGIRIHQTEIEDQEDEYEDDDTLDLQEDILRQMLGGLNLKPNDADPPPVTPTAPAPPLPPTPPSPPPAPFQLPDLNEVDMSVVPRGDTKLDPRPVSSGGGVGGSGWAPRTAWETDRDAKLGVRGEELVYHQELDRVRNLGYERPEEMVVWTSRDDPGADHDIRSIDDDGRVRWLEVKSTTGLDGRFEWSRKEFEKAMREGARYELWRVYQVGGTSPTAKCFPNPVELLGRSRLILELGTLRASIEGLA